MSKHISVSISELSKAIKEVQEYKEDLKIKCELYVRRLAELGIETAFSAMNGAKGDTPFPTFDVSNIEVFNAGNGFVIAVNMRGGSHSYNGAIAHDVLMWEFGAGIFFNRGAQNPLAGEMGYGVGTFPNQTHANENSWAYKDENGNWRVSNGTKAMMPMYNASVVIMNKAYDIAKEVFDV